MGGGIKGAFASSVTGDLTIGVAQSAGMADAMGLEGADAAKYIGTNLAVDLTVGIGMEGISGALKSINPSSGTVRPDFYVTPEGQAMPSTAYRYMDSRYTEQTMQSMSAPGSYFGFEKFDSASAAQDAFQVAPHWSDSKLRGEFDTLQVIDGAYVPKAYGGDGVELEPYTRSYPEYGEGGHQQYKYDGIITFREVVIIGD